MTHAIIKRSSLEGLAEGWDESCFAYVKPATYNDRKEFQKMVADQEADHNTYQRELVASHFVKGTVKKLNLESGEFELVDMSKEDLDINLVSDRLAMDIMGFELDPKEWAARVAAEMPQENESSTEAPSSTEQP